MDRYVLDTKRSVEYYVLFKNDIEILRVTKSSCSLETLIPNINRIFGNVEVI